MMFRFFLLNLVTEVLSTLHIYYHGTRRDQSNSLEKNSLRVARTAAVVAIRTSSDTFKKVNAQPTIHTMSQASYTHKNFLFYFHRSLNQHCQYHLLSATSGLQNPFYNNAAETLSPRLHREHTTSKTHSYPATGSLKLASSLQPAPAPFLTMAVQTELFEDLITLL